MRVEVPDTPKDDGSEPTGQLDGPDGPADRLESAGRVAKLMDELEMALRREEIDPKLMEDLGWNVEQAWRFVEEYRRQTGHAQRQTAESELPVARGTLPSRADLPAETLRATSGPAGDVRGLGTSHSPEADRVNQLRQIRNQRVPRALDPILRAYNSSFGSRPAE